MRFPRTTLDQPNQEPDDPQGRYNGLVTYERAETSAEIDEMEAASSYFAPAMIGLPVVYFFDAETGLMDIQKGKEKSEFFDVFGYEPTVGEVKDLYNRIIRAAEAGE